MSAPKTATEAALQAAQDRTATAGQLDEAAAAGRAAGRAEHSTGERRRCPYALGTLAAHVWLRWYVHARLTAKGMPE